MIERSDKSPNNFRLLLPSLTVLCATVVKVDGSSDWLDSLLGDQSGLSTVFSSDLVGSGGGLGARVLYLFVQTRRDWSKVELGRGGDRVTLSESVRSRNFSGESSRGVSTSVTEVITWQETERRERRGEQSQLKAYLIQDVVQKISILTLRLHRKHRRCFLRC